MPKSANHMQNGRHHHTLPFSCQRPHRRLDRTMSDRLVYLPHHFDWGGWFAFRMMIRTVCNTLIRISSKIFGWPSCSFRPSWMSRAASRISISSSNVLIVFECAGNVRPVAGSTPSSTHCLLSALSMDFACRHGSTAGEAKREDREPGGRRAWKEYLQEIPHPSGRPGRTDVYTTTDP